MITVGIDPGKSGAVAFLLDNDTAIFMDTEKGWEPIISALNNIEIKHVYLEKVHAMPGNGVSSMFSFGENFGFWQGVLTTLKLPHTLVSPQTWKRVMMMDMGKEKEASVTRAIQLFPATAPFLQRKKDHNRADALLLAAYGRGK